MQPGTPGNTTMEILARAADLAPVLEIIRPYTVIDDEQILSLLRIRDFVLAQQIEGDLVECGVCNGGSAAALAAGLGAMAKRTLWLYDTFAGMPPPGPEDPPIAHELTGAFKGSLASVQEVLRAVHFPWDRVVVRQGLFAETLAAARPPRIALLHIDADWYQSVLDCLRYLYPLVAEGGAIVLDDFGWWEGTRKAFYAFCEMIRVQPLLERSGAGQAYWIKGRESNANRTRQAPARGDANP